MRRTLTLVLALAVPSLAGCYTYVPAAGAPLSRGAPLRADLSRPMSFELPELTAHNIDRVEGELVRRDPDELVLSASWLDGVTGTGYPGRGWTLTIPGDALDDLRVKRLDRWRTGAVLVAAVAATWLGFDALRGSEGSGGTTDPGGQPR